MSRMSENANEECNYEAIGGVASAKVSEIQKLMAEAHLAMKKEAEDLDKKRTNFEEKSKKLDHVHFGSTIKLDVGGKIFKTSLETIRKDSSSMLASMFSGRFDLTPDENGAYFIDRDGKHFRYILNYLRIGRLICPKDEILLEELLEEAQFYQLQGIIDEVSTKLKPVTLTSVIITSKEQALILMSWFPEPCTDCSLLYRASRDGWGAKDFHRLCDDKGPTLIIGKSHNGYIFGGFTTQSWESGIKEITKQDKKSYLFTLTNPSGSTAIKMSSKSDDKGNPGGIRCQAGCGPFFGTSKYYDLKMLEDENNGKTTNHLDLGYGFECPTGKDRKQFFTGTQIFTLNEVDVFKITFN